MNVSELKYKNILGVKSASSTFGLKEIEEKNIK